MDNIDKKTVKKIGSLPKGFDSKSILFVEDDKIFIAKPLKKKKVKR